MAKGKKSKKYDEPISDIKVGFFCPALQKRVELDFSYVSFSSGECELCGSHSNVKVLCDCKKFHTLYED